jgi:hypothetical protein
MGGGVEGEVSSRVVVRNEANFDLGVTHPPLLRISYLTALYGDKDQAANNFPEFETISFPRSCVGMPSWTLLRPLPNDMAWTEDDAERRRRHSHAGAWERVRPSRRRGDREVIPGLILRAGKIGLLEAEHRIPLHDVHLQQGGPS